MVVSDAWQTGYEGCDGSTGAYSENLSAIELTTFSDVEIALMKRDAVPRAVLSACRNRGDRSVRFNAKKPRRGPDFAVGIARLDDIRAAVCIKGDTDRKREARCDGLDAVAFRNNDVPGPDDSRRCPVSLATRCRVARPCVPRLRLRSKSST